MENQHAIPVSAVKEPFNFMDFLHFKRMIALQVIPILYAVVAVVITLGGLRLLFSDGNSGYGSSSGFFDGGTLSGLLMITVGNVLWRMWCEFILVLFRINKSLQDVEKNTRQVRL